MDIEQIEASFVLVGRALLSAPENVAAFKQSIQSDVVNEVALTIPAAPANQSPLETQRLVLPRERISLNLTKTSSAVTKEYPQGPDDLHQLAGVIHAAISYTDPAIEPQGNFGFNAVLLVSPSTEPAFRYLARRIIRPTLFDATDSEITGASANMSGISPKWPAWNLRVEPRFNDQEAPKLFVALNHDFADTDVPSVESDILDHLTGVVDHARELIKAIDGTR